MAKPHEFFKIIFRQRTVLVLVSCLFGGIIALPVFADVGSEQYVSIGGSQSPAASYNFTGWETASYCSTPKSSARIYTRWYVSQVEASRAYIDRVYITVRPTRSGYWDNIKLADPNGRLVKQDNFPGNPNGVLRANTTASHTMRVGRWVSISTTNPIVAYSAISTNSIGQEPGRCFDITVATDFLKRR